jgi:hypothetical protein
MKKMVVFEESEFNDFLLKFSQNVMKSLDKECGYKMISKDSNKELDSIEELTGFLMIPWQNTINYFERR